MGTTLKSVQLFTLPTGIQLAPDSIIRLLWCGCKSSILCSSRDCGYKRNCFGLWIYSILRMFWFLRKFKKIICPVIIFTLGSTIDGSFYVNPNFSGFVILEKIFRWPHPIFALLWLYPIEEDLAVDLYKFEFHLPMNDLYQVWLKLSYWFWRRRLKKKNKPKKKQTQKTNLKTVYFHSFAIISPWGGFFPINFYNSEFHLPKDDLSQLWLKLAVWFWRRSQKCKSLTDKKTDGQTTDNGRSEKLTCTFSSGELKTICSSAVIR
jgi:hypothetical protein